MQIAPFPSAGTENVMGEACVYVVDDDPMIRSSMAFLLRSHALGCRVFAEGDELLSALDDLTPGCILLDLRMPRGSGLDVQAELARRGNTFPVIAMTAGDNQDEARRSLAMGAIDILEKPFEERALMAALGRGFDEIEANSGEHRLSPHPSQRGPDPAKRA